MRKLSWETTTLLKPKNAHKLLGCRLLHHAKFTWNRMIRGHTHRAAWPATLLAWRSHQFSMAELVIINRKRKKKGRSVNGSHTQTLYYTWGCSVDINNGCLSALLEEAIEVAASAQSVVHFLLCKSHSASTTGCCTCGTSEAKHKFASPSLVHSHEWCSLNVSWGVMEHEGPSVWCLDTVQAHHYCCCGVFITLCIHPCMHVIMSSKLSMQTCTAVSALLSLTSALRLTHWCSWTLSFLGTFLLPNIDRHLLAQPCWVY